MLNQAQGRPADSVAGDLMRGGRSEMIEQVIRAVAPGGTTLLRGIAPPEGRAPLDACRTTRKDLTKANTSYGNLVAPRDFPLAKSREFRVEPIIARTIPFGRIHEKLAAFKAVQETKSVIVYEDWA